MRKISLLAIFFLSVTAALAQTTIHDPYVEVRDVSGFHSIDVSGDIRVYLTEGEEAVAVSARDEDMKARIRTEVKNGILKIGYRSDEGGVRISISKSSRPRVYVACKDLKAISASGSAAIVVDGTIHTTKLSMKFSGGSDFEGKLEVEELKIRQSGGTNVVVSGRATTATIDVSGGSKLKGYDLVTDTCEVDASGHSDVSITVNKEFSAEASGASDVNWKGPAKLIDSDVSGSGTVSHKS